MVVGIISVCLFVTSTLQIIFFNIRIFVLGYLTTCVACCAYVATPYRAASSAALRGYTPIHGIGTIVNDAVLHLPSLRK